MFSKSEFAEWRELPLTQAMLKEIAANAGVAMETIMNRTELPNNDQYLKGFFHGLSQVSGWQPEYRTEKDDLTGETIRRVEDEEDAS